MSDLLYQRNHPFYDDWQEWKEIVHAYHSPSLMNLSLLIGSGFTSNQNWKRKARSVFGDDRELIFQIMELSDKYFIEIHEEAIPPLKEIWTAQEIAGCECNYSMPTLSCANKELHAKAHILSVMWALCKHEKFSKNIKRYYHKLQRVILSLPLDRLMRFPDEMILEPAKFTHLKNSLLRTVYDGGYLDEISSEEMVVKCEFLKHYRVLEQGGTFQSCSALDIQPLYVEIESILSNGNFDEILDRIFKVKEQGLFSVSHTIEDKELTKVREMLAEAKTGFISSFGTMLTTTGQSLMVMFAIASTIGILTQNLLKSGASMVLKILHVLYSLVFGSESEQLIRKSAVQQSGDKDITIPFIPAMIIEKVLSVPKSILTVLWKNPNIDMTMRRLGYLGDPKIDRGIDRLILWITNVIRQTRAWYCREILGISVPEDLEKNSQPIVHWQGEVDELVKAYYDQTLVWSETTWSVIYNLYSRGLTFTRSRMYAEWHRQIYEVVRQLGNILEKFKQHQRDGQSIRNPPVTVYLAGGTGVGKSSVTYPLAAEILKGIHAKEGGSIDLHKRWKNLIYMRSAEQEFWDGYENQLVTVFDDFCQQADSASNPNLELFEIIRASNCFPYPLHMASLDQKATTTFTSKVVLVSSNLEKPKTQSLNFPEALYRRFDLCVEVTRKSGYEGRLEAFTPEIYNFALYEMQTGRRIRNITYAELVQMCVDEYFARSSFVDSVDAYIEGVLAPISHRDSPLLSRRGDQLQMEVELQHAAREQGGEDEIFAATSEDEESWLWDQRDERSPSYFYEKYVVESDARRLRSMVQSRIDPRMDMGIVSFRQGKNPLDHLYSLFTWSKEKIMGIPSPFELLRRANGLLERQSVQLSDVWNDFKRNHPYIFKSLVVTGVIITSLAFLKIFVGVTGFGKTPALRTQGSVWSGSRAEGYVPKAIRTARTEGYSAPRIVTAKVEGVCEEGVKDLNSNEVLFSLVRKNLYKMYINPGDQPVGHCIFIKGKIALMCKHFTKAFRAAVRHDKNSTVYFASAMLKRSFEMKCSDLLATMKYHDSPEEENGPVATRDLATVRVDAAVLHSDLTNNFCTRASLLRVRNTEVVLPVMVKNDVKKSDIDLLLFRYRSGRSSLSVVPELSIGDRVNECVRYVRDAWRYEADTQATECGAPMLVRNSQISPGKIAGIHIAGIEGTGEGFSSPVYKEDIEMFLKSWKDVFTIEFQQKLECFPQEQGQIPQHAEFLRLGSIERPIYQAVKSTIEPSLCYAKIQVPKTKPCQLRPSQSFDPRRYRLERLGNIPLAISRDIVQCARDAYVDQVSCIIAASEDKLPDSVKATYSFEEAVLGYDGDRFVNSIKRTTSPGFPYVQCKGRMTRKDFFGVSDEYDLSSDACFQLKDRVHEIVEKAKRGVSLDHYFVDTLKDERKPIHKAHKTRLFSAGPLDYLVACKMYFNGPVALLQYNRNWSYVSVGTNPYSEDWGEIARSLLNKSRLMVAGDFEGFDASQHQMLLEASGEVLIEISRRFLGASDEDCVVMRVLLSSLLNSLHITGKEVYQWTHSLPSGHYLTAPINSIFVNLAFSCIWMIAHNNVRESIARSFWEHCGIVAYGDDHIVSIPPSKIDIFNQLVIPGLFQEIGLSYTMEDKDVQATRPFRDLSEISYLKRGFSRDDDGSWLAPLSLDTILETPMWMHRCPDPRLQTVENLEWALKELSLHDPQVWEQWSPVLRKQQEDLGFFTRLKNQEDVRMIVKAIDLEF